MRSIRPLPNSLIESSISLAQGESTFIGSFERLSRSSALAVDNLRQVVSVADPLTVARAVLSSMISMANHA